MFLSDSAIDVSGSPKEHICIGLVCFNSHTKQQTIKDFYDKFPHLLRSRWKATKLGENELCKIISFLDKNKVRMFAVEFTTKDWNYWSQFFGKEAFFPERIYAILYYKLLKHFCYRNRMDIEYSVTVCEESNLDINKVIDTCRRLCLGGKINVEFTKGFAKHVTIIKFADYVAGALRKVNTEDLGMFANYSIVNNALQERELNKAFRLYKKPELLKKIRR